MNYRDLINTSIGELEEIYGGFVPIMKGFGELKADYEFDSAKEEDNIKNSIEYKNILKDEDIQEEQTNLLDYDEEDINIDKVIPEEQTDLLNYNEEDINIGEEIEIEENKDYYNLLEDDENEVYSIGEELII